MEKQWGGEFGYTFFTKIGKFSPSYQWYCETLMNGEPLRRYLWQFLVCWLENQFNLKWYGYLLLRMKFIVILIGWQASLCNRHKPSKNTKMETRQTCKVIPQMSQLGTKCMWDFLGSFKLYTYIFHRGSSSLLHEFQLSRYLRQTWV